MARRKGPLVEQAYTYLRDKIITLEMPPGMVVSDYAYEKDLGMSRSPIREAIMHLIADGLVESRDGKMMVTSITAADIVEICQVRSAIEGAAVEILMERMDQIAESQKRELTSIYQRLLDLSDPRENYENDDLFHYAITEMAGNRRLCDVSQKMRLQMARARLLICLMPQRIVESSKEHTIIYNAIMNNDKETAVKGVQDHLTNSANAFISVLSSPFFDIRFLEMATSLCKKL